MKKILALILVLFGLLNFTSCDKEEDKYSVTLKDGSNVIEVISTTGELNAETPTKEGYVFGGWYKDVLLKEKWDNTTITKDMTLYASWYYTIATLMEKGASLQDGEIGTQRFTVLATIDSIDNPAYGQMTLKDSSGTISVYGSYSADGKIRYSELEEKPYADDVVIMSALLKNFKGALEITSGWILDFWTPEVEIDESAYTEMTIDAARNTEVGTLIKTTGVVARITYANGLIPSGFYLVDNTNSIYVYDSQIAGRVQIGNTVTVLGEKDSWILNTEINNAEKFGYKGCSQLSKCSLVSIDNSIKEFDKSWIQESTVKEILETPVTEDITTTIYKVNALVKKAPGSGFTNYYINDLDGTTGTYTYTQCNGSDFTWLDEFDGKICTVYLSVINAKSSAAGCVWRVLPVLVQNENYTFDTSNTSKFVVDYYGIDQFAKVYTGDPFLEVVTSVSSTLLGFTNATISYVSSNTDVVYFQTNESGMTVMHTKNSGEAVVTITGSYDGNVYTEEVTIKVEKPENVESVSVAEAINAELDSVVTVKGIVGPSLVNQVGFYLIDETGVLAIKTDAETMASLQLGQMVVMSGYRKRYVKAENVEKCFGQSCLLDSVLVANYYGKHDYATNTFITDKTLADIYSLDPKADYSTNVYVVEATIEVVETTYYTNINLVSNGTTLGLYCSSASQYNWLKQFAGQTVTVEVAACNWNDKTYYRGCVLAVRLADGTKVVNTLNFSK